MFLSRSLYVTIIQTFNELDEDLSIPWNLITTAETGMKVCKFVNSAALYSSPKGQLH